MKCSGLYCQILTRARKKQVQVSYLTTVIAPCRSKCCAQSPADGQVWPGPIGCRICLFYKHFVIQQAPRGGRQAQRRSKAAQGLHRAAVDCTGAHRHITRPLELHARCDSGSCASPTSGDQVDGLPLAPSTHAADFASRRVPNMTRRAPTASLKKLQLGNNARGGR